MEFATGAMGSLLAKLGELLKDEYKLQKGVREDVEYLKRELESMHAALGKVGEVAPEQLDGQVKVWARELRELSYDMEDVVDTFMVRVDQNSSKGLIKQMVELFKKGRTRRQIANEIQVIKARVQEVADRRNRNKVDDAVANPAAATTVDPRLSALYRKATDLVGIDEARDELIKRLTEGDHASKQQLKIVSVVGFGGMGKTTIANHVYQKLKMQFDCGAFVSISRNPDTKKVLRDILLDADKEKCKDPTFALWDERHLINELQKSLEHKRFNCMPTRKLTGQWRSRCLGSTLAVMKKSSKFLPVIGWSMWFAEYLFLERNWAKDEKTLKWGLQRLKDFPRPFWLALFVEGTRFTPAKLLAAQEYAASQGLQAPRNVLIPRTKGFVSAVSIMRDFVPAIYDTTVIIPKDSPQPTMLRILKGQSSVVHVRMKRHAMSEMPKSDEDVSKWCKDIFVAKDALLDKHLATGTFDEEIRPIGRPVKSLLVTLFWACLLLYGAIELFKWTQLLSTWKGVGFTVAGLALVTGVMHVFIMFSQSERSSSARAARNRVKKD